MSKKGFGIKNQEISYLFSLKNAIKIEEFFELRGGIEKIMENLETKDDYGINLEKENIKKRKIEYGMNSIKEKQLKFIDNNILFYSLFIIFVNIIIYIDLKSEEIIYEFLIIIVYLIITIMVDLWFKISTNINEIKHIRVIRSGKLLNIDEIQLLVGDILVLNELDEINIDGILISAENLILQSKNSEIKKSYKNDLVYSKSKVLKGEGKVLVLQIGENTTSFKKENEIKNKIEKNSFFNFLINLNNDCSIIVKSTVWIMSMLIILSLYLQSNNKNKFLTKENLLYFLSYLKIISYLFLISVPKSFIIAIYIFLSKIQKELIKNQIPEIEKNNLAKICDINDIIIDLSFLNVPKHMKIEKILLGTKNYNINELKNDNKTFQLMLEIIAFNINKLDNYTEIELLSVLKMFNFDLINYRENNNKKLFKTIEFSTDSNIKSFFIDENIQGIKIFKIGDFNEILKECTYFFNENNERKIININDRENILKNYECEINNGLFKFLACSFQDFKSGNNIIFVGGLYFYLNFETLRDQINYFKSININLYILSPFSQNITSKIWSNMDSCPQLTNDFILTEAHSFEFNETMIISNSEELSKIKIVDSLHELGKSVLFSLHNNEIINKIQTDCSFALKNNGEKTNVELNLNEIVLEDLEIIYGYCRIFLMIFSYFFKYKFIMNFSLILFVIIINIFTLYPPINGTDLILLNLLSDLFMIFLIYINNLIQRKNINRLNLQEKYIYSYEQIFSTIFETLIQLICYIMVFYLGSIQNKFNIFIALMIAFRSFVFEFHLFFGIIILIFIYLIFGFNEMLYIGLSGCFIFISKYIFRVISKKINNNFEKKEN